MSDINKTLGIFDLNIGDVIRNYLRTHHITQQHFAEALGLNKSKVDRLFQSRTIDTSLLVRISKELGYNFFAMYAGEVSPEDKGETVTQVHIGQIINQRLTERGVSQAQLAEALGVNQPVVSKLIKKESIDTGKLIEISYFLEYNFFMAFYYHPQQIIEDEKMKYSILLDKYTAVLDENSRLKAEIYDLRKIIEGKNK